MHSLLNARNDVCAWGARLRNRRPSLLYFSVLDLLPLSLGAVHGVFCTCDGGLARGRAPCGLVKTDRCERAGDQSGRGRTLAAGALERLVSSGARPWGVVRAGLFPEDWHRLESAVSPMLCCLWLPPGAASSCRWYTAAPVPLRIRGMWLRRVLRVQKLVRWLRAVEDPADCYPHSSVREGGPARPSSRTQRRGEVSP